MRMYVRAHSYLVTYQLFERDHGSLSLCNNSSTYRGTDTKYCEITR